MIETLRREAPWAALVVAAALLGTMAFARSPSMALMVIPGLVVVGALFVRPMLSIPLLLVSILVSDGAPLGISLVVPLTLSKLSMVVVIGTWLLHCAALRRSPVHLKMWLLPFFLLWVVVVVGLVWAPNYGPYGRDYTIGFATLTVLVVVIEEIMQPAHLRNGLVLLAWGWLITIALSIPFGDALYDANPVRHLGFGKNPNSWALAVLMGLGPAVAVFENQKGWLARWATPAAVAVAASSVIFTVSRAGILVMLVTTPILVYIVWRRRLVMAVAVAVAVVVVLGVVDMDAVWMRFDSFFDPAELEVDGSIRDRAIVQRFAIESFLDHPVIGVGTGGFQEQVEIVSGGQASLSTHNTYLQILAENGVIGALAFLGLVATIGWQLVRAWFAEKSPRFRRVTAGLLASLGAFALMMSTMNGLTFAPAFFFVGLALGWARLAHLPTEELRRHGLA